MLETEPDPGPVLEQLSVSERDLVREISVVTTYTADSPPEKFYDPFRLFHSAKSMYASFA